MSTSTPITSEQLAARTQRAVAAATAAGRELGLAVEDPAVLHDSFSVLVHLRPSPVVARVPVILPLGLQPNVQRARQERELAITAWLAGRNFPVVRPSPLVPPAPVQRDGFSITFWEHVEVDSQAEPDWDARAPLVADLHAALREYPMQMPFLSPLTLGVGAALSELEPHAGLLSAADVDRAQREWQLLAPVFYSRGTFAAAFPGTYTHTLHGDSPAYNLIETSAGARHADFEDVTSGPIEWDLTLLPQSALDAYDAYVVRIGLRRIDPELLGVMNVLRLLQVVSCVRLLSELPALANSLPQILDVWRALPFAGDFEKRGRGHV